MPHPPMLRRSLPFFVALLLTPPLAADWLVTEDGRLIETTGAWTIDGDVVRYVDAEGETAEMPVAEVDVEASRETTATKAGLPYTPPAQAEAAPAPPAVVEHEIILYRTAWCGYCRKAASLLEDLDVEFVQKDIEKDPAAADEYRKKGGGYRGIPLLDLGGKIVRGFNEPTIRQRVSEIKAEKARAGTI